MTLTEILNFCDTSDGSVFYDAAMEALTELTDSVNPDERANLQTAAITFGLLHLAGAVYSVSGEICNK